MRVRFVRFVLLEELLYSRIIYIEHEPPGAWRPTVEARSIELNLYLTQRLLLQLGPGVMDTVERVR